jgi:hypothetical protein
MSIRRLTLTTLASLCALAGGFAFSAVPALAAAPEAPVTISPAKAITATSAILEGTLNPGAVAKAGWYFAYSTEFTCLIGAATTPVEAEVEGKALPEHVEVTGLQPSRTYTFCMVATNGAGEQTPSSNEVSFTTLAAKPTVEVGGESTSAVGSTAATLEAQVNPNNQATTAYFQYSTSATVNGSGSLTGSTQIPTPPGTALGSAYGDQPAGPVALASLQPGTTYYYQAVATNATGTSYGTVQSFTTVPTPSTDAPTPIAATTATLNGHLTLNSVDAKYSFSYNAGGECTGGSSTPTGDAGTGAGSAPQATAVTGLLPNTQYTVCFLTSNAFGSEQGPAVSFTTLVAQPVIASEFVTNVESTSATLRAEVDPGGAETTYHFQYGTSTAYGQSTPESASIGADNTDHPAAAPIQGLEPGTTYHYRLVATNSQSPVGGTLGLDKLLATPTAAGQLAGSAPSEGCANERRRSEQPFGLKLPDCRAYEMVSPINKDDNDAVTNTCFGGEYENLASLSGEAIAYISAGSFAEPSGSRICDTYVSRRGPEGWSTRSITPPHTSLEGVWGGGRNPFEGMTFTPELSKGVVDNQSTPLTSEVPKGYSEVYLADFASGSYQWLSRNGLQAEAYSGQAYEYGPEYSGSTADLSHVFYDYGGTYESIDGGEPILVSANNKGENTGGNLGAGGFNGQTAEDADVWHAVSPDGKRIYFSTYGEYGAESRNRQIYLRENPEQPQSPVDGLGNCTVPADACTVPVSASQRTVPDPNGPWTKWYWGANVDGSKVFFTSREELTDNAYTGTKDNAWNLYEYDLETEKLTDLSVDTTGADTEGAAVLGVMRISEDGSYVYFVAEGKLAEGATAGATAGQGRQANLYVSHDGGAPKFIATLGINKTYDTPLKERRYEEEGESLGDDAGQDWSREPVHHQTAVKSDGTLAFVSEESVTGYDNERAENSVHECGENNRCDEVYLYDPSTGSLTCVSCNPSGARPIGPSHLTSVQLAPKRGLLHEPWVIMLPQPGAVGRALRVKASPVR